MGKLEPRQVSGHDVGAGLRRRDFIKGAALLSTAAFAGPTLLSACTSSAGRAKGEIKLAVYSAYVPPNIDFTALAKDYESRNSGTKVTVSVIPDSLAGDLNAFIEKFTLEARNKTASYDLIYGPTPWLEVAPLARAKALAPLDSYISSDVLNDMPKPVRTGNTYSDGKIYTLPMWADVIGLIYRTDLLKQAIGSDTPPQTWDELLTVGQELKQKLPSGVYAYGGDWNLFYELFLPILVTMTDTPFTANGVVNVEDPAALEALKLIQQLVPLMPPNAATQQLASSQVFQAKKLAMESYWQAQLRRALTAGVPQEDVAMVGNPRGNLESTVFWTTGVVLQVASPRKDEAMKFWIDGVLKNPVFQSNSVNTTGKLLTYTSMLNSVPMPDYMKPLAKQLVIGAPMPMNSAVEKVELPTFTTEVEKMVLKGQSPEQTIANLNQEFAAYKGD